VDLQTSTGGTALQLAEGQGHARIATLIRNKKLKSADRGRKDTLLQASPEKIKKQQEDADSAMKELLEEEDKDAAVNVWQEKKQAKKTGKVRDAADGQDGSQKEEHAEEQKKDTEWAEATAVPEKKKTDVVQLMGWSKDGIAPCLVYVFMEGGSLQDRLACRGSGALVPLTTNERMLVLSDVARGLAYLHSDVRVIHRDVKSANVLLDNGRHDRVGDFGIARSLNDNHSGITATHMHTENVMGTQVYMTPEYKSGELSTKVDTFAFGLVVLETLTGFAVCSLAPGHRNLLSMFQDELDTADKLREHLDKRACWDQHKQERMGSLYDIADRCLELNRKKRPELVKLVPELEEVRRGTEALQTLEAARAVGLLVEAEAAEKGMPNGGQTCDPCVRLTFQRTGLAGEGSAGSRIGMMQF
jgi:serine/threonine protein kinase